MIVDLATPSRTAKVVVPKLAIPEMGSEAEILDTLLSDDLKLRALVCRLDAGKWQWTISSLDGDRGELISTGTARSAAAARLTAAAEITKCIETAIE